MDFKKKLEECTHNNKFHWITCWGILHTIGMLAFLYIAELISFTLVIPFAIIGSIVVIVHEYMGPGDLLNSTDRILDWVLPIIAAVIFIVLL